MGINKLYINPYIRLLFLVCTIIGILLINNTLVLSVYYLLVILPVFIYSGQLKTHTQLLAFGMIPIFLTFILLYILVLKGEEGGWNFIFLRIIKLVIVTSAIQLTLLIPSSFMTTTLKKWHIKGEALITVLGAFTVWTDVMNRTQKILTARFSRGFIQERTVIEKIKQFPSVLIPLIIGVLRTSTERAESWEQKDVLYLMEINKMKSIKTSSFLNYFLLITSLAWFTIGICFAIYN